MSLTVNNDSEYVLWTLFASELCKQAEIGSDNFAVLVLTC